MSPMLMPITTIFTEGVACLVPFFIQESPWLCLLTPHTQTLSGQGFTDVLWTTLRFSVIYQSVGLLLSFKFFILWVFFDMFIHLLIWRLENIRYLFAISATHCKICFQYFFHICRCFVKDFFSKPNAQYFQKAGVCVFFSLIMNLLLHKNLNFIM